MDDLICRSALLNTIYGDKRPEVYDGQDIANWQMKCIECAPAVDAEPVRHGRWIQIITAPSYHYCSYCKSIHKMTMSCNKYVLLKYCPNCGAKMDGEMKDDG